MRITKRARPLIFSSSDYTHKGYQREENEDAIYSDCRGRLWCVADGMGGHLHGRIAAERLVKALAGLSCRGLLENRVKEVEARVFELNLALYKQGRQLIESGLTSVDKASVIGCTFVILLSDGVRCCCLWVGDSRLYLQRDSHLFQVTDDHTLMSELIGRGVITPKQAIHHPQKHVVTRALGATNNIVIDKKVFLVADTDRYLLCSDGLYQEMHPDDILSALSEAESRQICKRLFDKALQGKGRDNLSACVVIAGSGRC